LSEFCKEEGRKEGRKENAMKTYETPELIEYGTIHELTQFNPTGGYDGDGGSQLV
jgi:hypothetical protein